MPYHQKDSTFICHLSAVTMISLAKRHKKPSIKIFLLTVPRRYLFCGSYVFFVSCVSQASVSVLCCLVVNWKGLTSWLFLVMFIVFLSLSHVVSWVRCCTWLYRFPIFAVFLTYNIKDSYPIFVPCLTSVPIKGTIPQQTGSSLTMYSYAPLKNVWTQIRQDMI